MKKKDIQFDVNKALEDLKAGKPLHGEEGFLTPLIKQLTEAALQAEQEQHFGVRLRQKSQEWLYDENHEVGSGQL